MQVTLRHIEHRPTDRWALFLLTVLLGGYAFLGSGFAYLGVAPLFIGEITLGVALVAALSAGRFFDALRGVPAKATAAFIGVGALRLSFDLPTWGVMALRDAVVWGYGLFAFAVAALLLRDPERLRLLFERYRRFVPWFLVLAGPVYLIAKTGTVPRWPMNGEAMLTAKGGDMLVHLAGATAFLMVGLGRWRWWLFVALAIDLVFLGVANRGGMVSYLLACGLVVAFQSRRVKLAVALYATVLAVSAFVLIDPRIPIPGGREISMEQFSANFRSIAGDSDEGALSGTKEWRLNWWKQIVSYTFTGPYFLQGKGFGINLATDDGFQVSKTKSLRSPHNGHMTILARMGVPGILLWILAQGAWALGMLTCMLRARRRGEDSWHGIFLFLLAYWSAFIINASFDVYLEGPMGGIWFWVTYGFGLAAMELYRRFDLTAARAARAEPCPTS